MKNELDDDLFTSRRSTNSIWENEKLATLTYIINVDASLLHSYVLSVHACLLGRWCMLYWICNSILSILQPSKKLCAADNDM